MSDNAVRSSSSSLLTCCMCVLGSAVHDVSQWRDRDVALFGVETSLHIACTDGASLRTTMHEDIDGTLTLTQFVPVHSNRSISGTADRASRELTGLVLCSLNLWHFTAPYEVRLPRMRALLTGCDIAMLQEVRYRWVAKGSAHSRWMVSDFVASDTTVAWHWSRAMTYFEGSFHHDEGLAFVVSRSSEFVVIETHTTFLSRDSRDQQDEHQRVLLRARLEHRRTGAVVQLFVTHMSLSLSAQRRNAVEIVREMQRHSGVQILMVDVCVCVCVCVFSGQQQMTNNNAHRGT